MVRPDFTRRSFDVLRVLEVHDGDSFRLLLDTGFEVAAYPWLRLRNYSCPELRDPGGPEARAATDALLRSSLATCWAITYKIPPDLLAKQAERYGDSKRTFARYVADIWLRDELLLGEELVRLGHARVGAFIG